MIIAAIRDSRANRAGDYCEQRRPMTQKILTGGLGEGMPRGRSTFTKRQKEQTRQQRQRDKAERRSQRKQEKAERSNLDEMAELHEHAAAQAALFNLAPKEEDAAEDFTRMSGSASDS
jgi:hypothetical protein